MLWLSFRVFIDIFGSYLEICFAYGFPLINHTISFYENKVTIVSNGQTGFKPRWRQEIFSCPKLSRPAPETITLPIQWVPGFFPERPRSEVNTQLHLVLRLKMSGATLLPPLYPFMAWAGTNLLLLLLCIIFYILLKFMTKLWQRGEASWAVERGEVCSSKQPVTASVYSFHDPS